MNVELTDHAGSDTSHALSAWTSTHRDLDPQRVLRIPQLLSYLAGPGEGQKEHGSPFEKSYLQFLIRVDTVTHYQILKHRIGVSINVESARYKELDEPTCHLPADWPDSWQDTLDMHFMESVRLYKLALEDLTPRLGRKRAKESARFFLPLANELTMDVSFNFRSFVHFQKLRNHDTAQREIAAVADSMLDQVKALGKFDASIAAFKLDPMPAA